MRTNALPGSGCAITAKLADQSSVPACCPLMSSLNTTLDNLPQERTRSAGTSSGRFLVRGTRKFVPAAGLLRRLDSGGQDRTPNPGGPAGAGRGGVAVSSDEPQEGNEPSTCQP